MSSPISGFTAIPNPQMLAFMPIQSYLMMYFAGAGWQIGKRKISAIPNDQFNKMSAKQLLEGFTADLRSTIPTLRRSLEDITPLIAVLIEQYGDFIKIALEKIPQVAQDVVTSQFSPGSLADILMKMFPNLPSADAKMMAEQIQKKSKSGGPSPDIIVKKPFQGPEIDPSTGEKTPFVEEILKPVAPASHIIPRPVSNVSMQSLLLERTKLWASVAASAAGLRQHLASKGNQTYTQRRALWESILSQRRSALEVAKKALANFMAMHGSRF